jgi:hypothetical protein
VKAGINSDGFQFGDMIDRPLTKPFMFMGAQRPWAGDSTIANDVFFQKAESSAYVVPHGDPETQSAIRTNQSIWSETPIALRASVRNPSTDVA